MRSLIAVVLAFSALLVLGQAAHAWPVTHKYKHHAYYPAPLVQPVAPLTLGQVANVVGHILVGVEQAGGGSGAGVGGAGRTQPVKLPPVDPDVVKTIQRVDQSLNDLVKDTNELAKLNPKYKKPIESTILKSGGSTGKSSGPSGEKEGESGPP
jgi:hypothetical protein